MNDENKIVLSRALTNSGDQAWDFAVPVSLAVSMPGRLDLVAFVFFLSRLSHILILPLVGNLIDQLSRSQTFKIGLTGQFLGVGIQSLSFIFLTSSLTYALAGIVIGGVLSGLGSSMTNIGVAQDLVPTLFSGIKLTKINSRIRQVDLFSEVLSPVLAGAILILNNSKTPFLGLFIVAFWNLFSFFPEFYLLKDVLKKEKINSKKTNLTITKIPIWKKLSEGWRELIKLSIAPAIFAYALLWLSALSPHGVLLTSFLKESWNLPELTLGFFRGFGAIFGLIATITFPILVKKYGLHIACKMSILFQSGVLIIALFAFHLRYELVFLGLILFSRIGLYGFSLGEQQLRQIGIPENRRGTVNASATALTGIATLTLLGLGSLLGSIDQFQHLVDISVACVVFAALLYVQGMKKN